MQITSAHNEIYKRTKKLISKKSYRYEEKKFFIEGIRLFEDALRSGYKPEYVFLRDGSEYDIDERYLTYTLSRDLFDSLCDTKNPQPAAAVFNMKKESHDLVAEHSSEKLLILCNIQDPGNMGTILRTAEAFGLNNIIITSDSVDIYSPKT